MSDAWNAKVAGLVDLMLESCGPFDSPLERLFFLALLTVANVDLAPVKITDPRLKDALSEIETVAPDGFPACYFHNSLGGLVVIGAKVGAYKPDLVFLFPTDRDIAKLVVELDGHDFHEKTKEQAAHDKKRDRWLQLKGYAVLRFTGSEVFAEPVACASAVSDYACNEWHRRRSA